MLPTNIPKPEAFQVIMRFRAIDKDNSGALALEELVTILMEMLGGKMAESNVRRLASMQFQVADRDKSGTLSIEEFLQIWGFIREQVDEKTSLLHCSIIIIIYC
jgi:Ca2+-binding EF-hand superfamily protein